MIKPGLLIMAAGMGSRYGSLKQIDPIGPSGEAIIDYSVYDAIRAGYGNVVFVIRKNIETDFRDTLLKRFEKVVDVDYVFQELEMLPKPFTLPPHRLKPWGTAHAILVASEKINTPFAAINADDFYGFDAFQQMANYLSAGEQSADYSMVGYLLKNTLSAYGSVSRGVCEIDDKNFLKEIHERTNIKKEGEEVFFTKDGNSYRLNEDAIVSMNFWGFTPDIFEKIEAGFKAFLHDNISDPKSEYYIPALVDELINSQKARVKVLTSNSSWFGVTYREDKEHVVKAVAKLVENGFYPVNLWK
jgi:UTP-glucose-1-phosphate uridylyltransferase